MISDIRSRNVNSQTDQESKSMGRAAFTTVKNTYHYHKNNSINMQIILFTCIYCVKLTRPNGPLAVRGISDEKIELVYELE